MKKSLIALAALGAIASSAMAQSSVTLYGIVDLGLVKQSNADKNFALGGVGVGNKELNVAQATKSRIGFRGVEDLGGGLSVKFDLEHRFLPDTGAVNTTGDNQFWDKSIVGITSQTFGEVTLGRDYMPLFYSQYLLDPWLNQGIAEMGASSYAWAGYARAVGGGALGLAQDTRSVRYNNGIFYKAQAAGFTAILGASLNETDVDGTSNRYGINVMYNAGPLFITAAYDQDEAQSTLANLPAPLLIGLNGQKAIADESVWLIGVAYDFGFIKPRLSYTEATLQQVSGFTPPTTVNLKEIKPTAWTLAATMPTGSGLIQMGYQSMDYDIADIKTSKFSLGYEHTLSKRTALYVDVTSGKFDEGKSGQEGYTANGVDLGIRHAF